MRQRLEVGNTLRLVPCLRGLSARALGKLRDRVRQRRRPRGTILFREGAPCEHVFMVLSGTVNVYRLSPEGRQQTLWTLTGSDCFCLAPFFQRARYPGTAECMTEVRVLELSRAAMLTLPRTCPGLAEAVVSCLCHRLATTAALLEDVSTQHVRDRLARLLLILAESRGVNTASGVLLQDGWTHDELASRIGTVREVVSRILKDFEREGLVRLGRRRLFLLDPSRLKARLFRPAPPIAVR